MEVAWTAVERSSKMNMERCSSGGSGPTFSVAEASLPPGHLQGTPCSRSQEATQGVLKLLLVTANHPSRKGWREQGLFFSFSFCFFVFFFLP